MTKGKNKRWNLRSTKREGPRRIKERTEIESGNLEGGWVYRIIRWELTTGSMEFRLEIDLLNNVGMKVHSTARHDGQLDHAQQSIQKLLAEVRTRKQVTQ